MTVKGSPNLLAAPLAIDGMAAFAAVLREAGLPDGDLANDGRAFWRFETAAEGLVGYGGIEIYGTDGLLRSLVVVPGFRGCGFGAAILKRMVAIASAAGVRDIYLLTSTARGFFEHAGFAVMDRGVVPAVILMSEQAARLCPATAFILHRRLGTGG